MLKNTRPKFSWALSYCSCSVRCPSPLVRKRTTERSTSHPYWFFGQPAPGAYSICYVNAFQTQPDDDAFDRPDERCGGSSTAVDRAAGGVEFILEWPQ